MIIFYFLFIVFYFFITIWRPQWALFLICALLPTYQIRFQIFGLPTTLLEIMILILFLVWFIKFKKYKIFHPQSLSTQVPKHPSIQSWLWLILAWLAISLIAVFISPNKWAALGHWRAYFLEPILLLAVIFSLPMRTDTDKEIQTRTDTDIQPELALILYGLGISAFYCSLWAILQKIFHFGGVMSLEAWQYPLTPIWRATGPFPQPNFLGLYLAPITILLFGQLLINRKNRLKFIVYGLAFISSLIAIILARSEGAILGILASLAFFSLFSVKGRRWLAIVFIGVILANIIAPQVRSYFIQKITFQDLSGQLRLNIWRGTVNLIKDHPIFGVGLRGYQKLIPQYQKPYYDPKSHQLISVETHPYPHNLFLAIWSELGIFGLIIFLIIIFQFFRFGFKKISKNLKLDKILIITILSVMVVILIHGLVDTPYFKNDLAILFWLIIGLVLLTK